jgi:hypothetical protein
MPRFCGFMERILKLLINRRETVFQVLGVYRSLPTGRQASTSLAEFTLSEAERGRDDKHFLI